MRNRAWEDLGQPLFSSFCPLAAQWAPCVIWLCLCRRKHPDMLMKNNVWRQFPGLGTAACLFAAYVVWDKIIPEFGGGHGHADHGHGVRENCPAAYCHTVRVGGLPLPRSSTNFLLALLMLALLPPGPPRA